MARNISGSKWPRFCVFGRDGAFLLSKGWVAVDGGTRCRWGQGRAKAIIFSMATELLSACLIFFVPAIIIVCFVDREAVGLIILAAAIVVAWVIVWVRDKFKSQGVRRER